MIHHRVVKVVQVPVMISIIPTHLTVITVQTMIIMIAILLSIAPKTIIDNL